MIILKIIRSGVSSFYRFGIGMFSLSTLVLNNQNTVIPLVILSNLNEKGKRKADAGCRILWQSKCRSIDIFQSKRFSSLELRCSGNYFLQLNEFVTGYLNLFSLDQEKGMIKKRPKL